MPKDSFKNSPFPDALKNFDLLPSAALVRQPIVEALYGCSSTTVRRRVADWPYSEAYTLLRSRGSLERGGASRCPQGTVKP